MLSITSDMRERQGLDAEKWYEAYVVANDDRDHPDGMMLGRIQARIAVLFDGIADEDLPWAIPNWNHVDGASPLSGVFSVPKVSSKVYLKFQQANPAFPVYRGYHVDVLTQMEEVKHNYPDRAVIRFQNKAMLIVDTKDNVLYLRNPGNVKIFVDGNVALEVNGDVDELIHGDVRRTIKGDLDEVVHGDVRREYKSDYDFTITGTLTRLIKGIYHNTVLGWHEMWTGGFKTESVIGYWKEFSLGLRHIETKGRFILEGESIEFNSDNQLDFPTIPTFPDEPEEPTFHKWPGVPGSAKGTNMRNPISKESAAKPCPEYEKDPLPKVVNGGIDVPEEKGPEPPIDHAKYAQPDMSSKPRKSTGTSK